MKTLKRNKVPFFYSLYEGKAPIVEEDEYGNKLPTGEYEVKYGNPIRTHGNISAARGETQTRQFGENESYDKVLVMDNTSPPIDEYSVLWVDTLPTFEEDGTTKTPHDYVVVRKAASLNSVSFAIRKVNVSYG